MLRRSILKSFAALLLLPAGLGAGARVAGAATGTPLPPEARDSTW